VIPPFLFRAGRPAGAVRPAAWLCLAVALVAGACGKKGPPLPPLARVPAAPANVTASRSGNDVTVRFTVPVANITGVQPADLERVDIYAWTGPNLPASEIFKHATVIATVPVRRPPPPAEPAEEGKPAPPPPPPSTEPGLDQGAPAEVTETLAPDAYEPLQVPQKKQPKTPPAPKLTPPALGLPMPPPLQRFYLVVGVNHGGSRGTPAAPAAVPLWPAPPAPTDLAARVREGGVDLTWTPPPVRRAPVYSGPVAAPQAAAASPATPAAPAGTPGQTPAAAASPGAVPAATAAPATPQAAAAKPAAEAAGAAEAPAAPAGEASGTAEGESAAKPLPARLIFPWTAWTAGFLVYEVAAPTLGAPAAPPPAAQPFPKQLTPSPIPEPKFTDPRVEFGVERCYTVRAVETFGTLSVQSENAAPPACIKPSDVFPPAAPKSLAAVASPGAVSLIWEANGEPDLGGYLVYRSQAPDGQPQLLTPAPIRETTYRDERVKAGTRYSYFVVAVDVSTPPNVSERSNPVEEIAR